MSIQVGIENLLVVFFYEGDELGENAQRTDVEPECQNS